MGYTLRFATTAQQDLAGLQSEPRKLTKVGKALAKLEANPRHPGLSSHQYQNFPGEPAGKIWESYVENNTPQAWRIFWRYGPDEHANGQRLPVITILAITPHP